MIEIKDIKVLKNFIRLNKAKNIADLIVSTIVLLLGEIFIFFFLFKILHNSLSFESVIRVLFAVFVSFLVVYFVLIMTIGVKINYYLSKKLKTNEKLLNILLNSKEKKILEDAKKALQNKKLVYYDFFTNEIIIK